MRCSSSFFLIVLQLSSGFVIGAFEPDLEAPLLTPDSLLKASRDTDCKVIMTVPSIIEVGTYG